MNCARCGSQSPDRAKFCLECGAAFAARCAACGTELPPAAKFCLECGAKVVERATPSSAPRDYTPRHLAEKILQSKSALEGERKQVTVLFADVKGSMELAEQLDPEEWHRILERFFEILTDGVHRFEGTVNQYTGDGIMALFGAPLAHEDHAQRACYAALHLQQELRRYADEMRLEHALNFSVRMGLNSGEVVVGKIGDDLRMDYTAQGHTVGLAARMEQIAEAGKALLTEHTAKLVSGYFVLRDLGKTRIKGLNEPLHVFDLEGVGRMRTRLEVSHARGFSKFVGRQSEMAALEAALQRAIAGNAQVVGVVAEPGTGKSRLCYEFVEGCRAREIPVYEGHGVAHGKAVPLLPVLEFQRSYFGITEQDTPRAARDKIAGRMLLLDDKLAEGLPIMFEFLGVPDPERPAPPLGPEARQRQVFDVIRRLARARSAREPAAYLFEDLHWFDRASEEFIENLVVEIAPGNRTLMLLNFRPEYHAAWMQRSYYQQLPLLPLSPEEITELLGDLLGADRSLRRLRELIQERTGGNPFFIEEIVQSLIETGALAGTRGAYRLVTPAEEVGLPATVQSVLAARIDRLPEREKRVLQTASVIGKQFSEPILKRVASLGDGDLPAALHALTSAEFLYREALYPEAEYTFKHPLTQEVAYRSQLSERRSRVHAAVARAIEEVDSGKLGERAALLAYHWERAGEARVAAKWHSRAAEWVGLNNPSEALRHWGSVRQLLDTLPETPENLVERAAVRAQIMNHLGRLGDVEDQAISLFREGRELAARSGDPHVLSQILNAFGLLRLFAGAIAEALDPLLESIRLADETEDIGLRVAVRYGLSGAYFWDGRLRECLAVAEQGLALARGDLDLGADRVGFSPSLGLSLFHGAVLSLTGHPREGAAELDRVIELARTSQQLMPLGMSHAHHAFRCEVTGEAVPALAHGREAVDYTERTGNQAARSFAYFSLGLANLLNGAWHDALEVLGTALTIGRERRLSLIESYALGAMAAAHLGLGDRAKALAIAEEAIAVSRPRGARLYEFSALLTRIRALRETHELAEKTLEIYWPQAAPFVLSKGESILKQSGKGQAEIVSAIRKFRERHAPDPSAPLFRARTEAPERYEDLVGEVEWILIEMPIPRLQLVGNSADPFIYQVAWNTTVKRRDIERPGFERRIRLVTGAGERLVQLAGLLRPLVQRRWAAMVARFNRTLIQDSRLEEFLFGVSRVSLDPVRRPLRDVQDNRCFYCDTRIASAAEVDHFIPWSRHPDNGIENLVIADRRCNSFKRDFVPATEHLERWRAERFGPSGGDLPALNEIASELGWEHHPKQTFAAAGAIFLRLPPDAELWHREKSFVAPRSEILSAVFGPS